MPFKKLIKTVKENHSKLKEKARKEKAEVKNNIDPTKIDDIDIKDFSKKGIGVKSDIFIEKADEINKNKQVKTYRVEQGDTLKGISEKIFGSENKWIMFHLKNIHKIPNPHILTAGMILDIPLNNEVNNFYEITSPKGNYIIAADDNIKSIALKIFGSEKFTKKLIDWNFFKFTKDIYPGKEIKGLKYLDLDRQIKVISKKYDFKSNDYKDFIIEMIIKISAKENSPAVIPLLLADTNFHWFDVQKNKDLPISENLWSPLNIDNKLYKDIFPRSAMDIEFNICFAITKLKELRKIHKNWPRAIVAFRLESLPGVGKPEEQKVKVKGMLQIIDPLIEKMNNKVLAKEIKTKIRFQDNEHISFDLLHRELIDYKEFCLKKYL